MARYDLSETEWRLIEPLLPNKPRGVARVDDRRVINGIFYVLRTGSPWRDLPSRYGPHTTVYNRFNRGPGRGLAQGLRGFGGRIAGLDALDRQFHHPGAPACRRWKRGPGSRHRPFSWRTEHQDQRPGRSGRTAVADCAVGRSGFRQGRSRSPDRWPQAARASSPTAAMTPAPSSISSPRGVVAPHPDAEGPQDPAYDQSRTLPPAQPHRAILLQTQTLPAHRNALRQTRQKLPRSRNPRISPNMAQSL